MPCYSTGTAEGDARLAADEARKSLTQVTQLLCQLCAHVEKSCYGNIIRELPDVSRWWEQHKVLDAARRNQASVELQRHTARLNALGKLTAEDKQALGLWP